MNLRYGFIGCGNLAQSLIRGALDGGLSAKRMAAVDRSSKKLKSFANETGIHACSTAEDLLAFADVIFLATKPQDLSHALEAIDQKQWRKKHAIVSLAAGVSGPALKKKVPHGVPLIRVMANLAASVREGLFVQVAITKVSARHVMAVSDFLEKSGKVIHLPNEELMDAFTAGVASGCGFVFAFMEAFEQYFIAAGFSRTQARLLAVDTFFGSAQLARQRFGESLEVLRAHVTSKKGTTWAGLTVMKQKKTLVHIRQALRAAERRGRALQKIFLKASSQEPK